MNHRPFNASGLQIAFLVFAVVFLGAPAQKYIGPLLTPEIDLPRTIGRLFFFLPAIVILVTVAPLRRHCAQLLRQPIDPAHRTEVAVVTAAQVVFAFAISGGVVLWHWMAGGEMGLARRIGQEVTGVVAMGRALSPDGIALLVLAVLVAPIVEELVFRGILFRTWEAEWGWPMALVASSLVFAAYHPVPVAAFFGSILLTTLFRRTGSIRACILAHAAYNALLWYPLMGRFIFQTAGRETGEIQLWFWNLLALSAMVIALPAYVWIAREPADDSASARTATAGC